MHLNKIQDVPYEGHEIYPIHMAHPILSESVWNDDEQREQGNISNGLREDIYYFITGTLGLAGLFEYMSVPYLKTEVAKYICSLLRIFKIACQTKWSRDLIMEYKWLCL